MSEYSSFVFYLHLKIRIDLLCSKKVLSFLLVYAAGNRSHDHNIQELNVLLFPCSFMQCVLQTFAPSLYIYIILSFQLYLLELQKEVLIFTCRQDALYQILLLFQK
jgi:hypothetical protein